MTNDIQTTDNRSMGSILLGLSLSILFLHLYRYCPGLFGSIIPGKGVVHDVLSRFTKNLFFEDIFTSKLAALGLLVVYLLTDNKKSDKMPNWGPALYSLLIGLALYFGGIILIDPDLPGSNLNFDWGYLVTCLAGYLLVLSGVGRLILIPGRLWENRDIFNKNATGFPQERRLIETDYSINLQAKYLWKGRWRKSWINIINPRRGIVVIGSPGSGKWSDCNGNIESVFTKDELLSNVSLYWYTETIHSSIRLYNENSQVPLHFSKKDFVNTPIGIARFHKEEPFPPRKFIERGYNIQHWTDIPKGGHFAAMEQPALLANDIIQFAKTLNHIK